MRIFFGATLPDSVKMQIIRIQEELRPSVHDAKFEGKDKLHITLQFIGDFKFEKLPELFSSVESALKELSPKWSAVEVVGMNFFPSEKIRRGIWLDCQDDGTLSRVSETIKSVTAKFGIVPEDRPFKPHITIARLKDRNVRLSRTHTDERSVSFRHSDNFGRDRVEDLKKFESEGKLRFEKFSPVSIALFESRLNRDKSGSEYKILSEISASNA
ncbi:MAG TPA: RNA 2',3'-cyclic phosphodiesterase [Candidatus Acidoferrales bacterium]|nr:RNA 2',3'-cyclic phosphodiesterase [Candidatus Acidoferrales bacterium]